MRTLRVVLVLLLLGTLAAVVLAQGGAPRHEHGPSESGEHQHEHGHGHDHGHGASEPGVHQHEHGHGHVHGEGEDEHTHLPIQMYAIKAYFESPWRDSTQPGRIAWQAGLVALVDAALLAWLWRRWWR